MPIAASTDHRPTARATRPASDTSRPARRRAVTMLFAASALVNAAMATTTPVATIAVAGRLGAAWGGLPATAAITGTGIGALLSARVTGRAGRAGALASGYAAAVVGAALGFVAVGAPGVRGVAGPCAGMALLGLGNAAALLSRYAAADLYPARRRGFAIGTVVWAGAVGAVGGPLLLVPSGEVASGLGRTVLAGPFLLALAAAVLALLATAGGRGGLRGPAGAVRASVGAGRSPLRGPAARSALAVMATAQVVMVAVMTATPLDMHDHGRALGPVGAVLSAHTLGMFALSPLTGRLLDRIGSGPVMVAGLLVLAVSTAGEAAGAQGHPATRTTALFLLGYGWNLCFVGGSGRLTRGLTADRRLRVEGAVDAAVWGFAAVAGLASTAVLAGGGYALLAGLSGSLVAVPAGVLLANRYESGRSPRPAGVGGGSVGLVLIRECVRDDLELLEVHMPTGRNRAHARILDRQDAGECSYLVAWEDGAPVGSCAIRWAGLHDEQARRAYPDCPEITNLGVPPALRNRGIGTALVREAEERVRARGHVRVGLGVSDDNPMAARLYARLGYVDTGLRWTSAYTYFDESETARDVVERNLVLVRTLA